MTPQEPPGDASVTIDTCETTAGEAAQEIFLHIEREGLIGSEEEWKRLAERRLEERDLLLLYWDGVIFGDHQVRVAVGVDREGRKQVLGIAEGASENETVARGLLGRVGEARAADGPEIPVCDRRLEGAPSCD